MVSYVQLIPVIHVLDPAPRAGPSTCLDRSFRKHTLLHWLLITFMVLKVELFSRLVQTHRTCIMRCTKTTSKLTFDRSGIQKTNSRRTAKSREGGPLFGGMRFFKEGMGGIDTVGIFRVSLRAVDKNTSSPVLKEEKMKTSKNGVCVDKEGDRRSRCDMRLFSDPKLEKDP